MLLFDSVSPLERIKLTGQLSKKVPELVSAKSEKQPLKVVRLSAEIAAILSTLGVSATPSQPVDANQVETARHYPQEQRRTPGARQKDNDRAVALLNTLQAEGRKATDEEKAVLARFSGYGGGLTDPEGKEGSPYEYYTPPPIASGVWEIVKGMGFTGGKVLDPSAGSGVFAATRPASAVIDQVELSPLSGGVNALVNDGPTVSTRISPFEAVAAATPDESYDAVITNVPFGDNSLREFKGADPKYQGDSLEAYFILRSLDKLKPGGLAAFITPPRCVSGSDAKSKDLRFKASLKAEFMGAYRLPNKIFQDASNADTIVDVIVFRKHSVEAKAKIDELAQQDTAVLGEAKVLWDEFLKGKYFAGEGRKYMLGEFKAGDKTKIRDADRVISDQSTANIAKLLQKFPGSRINWELLNTAEVAPIVYRDGDTIYQDGRTLEYQAGKWIPRESTASEDQEVVQTGIDVQTPLAAVSAGVNWAQVGQYVSYMRNRSRTLDIPDWITSTHDCLMRMKEGERADWFLALAAGLATVDVVQRHAQSEPFNYAETYPKLTSAMVESARFGGKSNGVLTKALRDGLTALGVMYTRKNGFHPRWKGEGKADIDVAGLTPRQAYEKLKYEASDDFGYIAIDRLAETQGADFDPYSSDDWCVSPDGKSAIAAGDYFTGRYADVLSRLGDDLQAAGDPKVRDKILRQQSIAESRLLKPDPERITFNLFSPFVSVARKVEFLRENVDQRFAIEVDETGKPQIVINIPSAKNERERQLKRYAEHLRVGTLTTRTSQEEAAANPELEARRLAELRELVSSGNTRFNVWVKSNGDAFDEVKRTLLAPENLYFREEQDTSALTIDGMNPELSLHDYQRAEVRRQAKKFGGINGFDVGLGKAQPLDAKILTPDGWRRMGDIKVGDLVIAVDGSAVPVTGVYPQGKKEIFEVEFSDGAKTRCCDEHLWFTETENDRAKSRYHAKSGRSVTFGSVKPLSDIRQTLLVGPKQKNHRIPMMAPAALAEKNLAIDPYVLGVLLGDGCLCARGITFTPGDDWIGDKVKSIISNGDYGVSVIEHSSKNRAKTYGISLEKFGNGQNPVLNALLGMGLFPKKSHEKFVPDDYLFAAIEQRKAILHGLMDTDGYVSKDGKTVQFTSTAKPLAEAVVHLAQSLGGTAWMTSKTPTYTYQGEKREGLVAYTVSLSMPSEINPFSLPRKASRVSPRSKYQPARFFVNVRSVGMDEAQCISIDHPTRLYVTDDFIVTHNTFTALASVQYAQSIGVKKKTIFVVPNAVLSNWRKEASRAYASIDDCLFVGLDVMADGSLKVSSGNYARDMATILENRHRKIFMTLEAFTSIPMRPETLDAYKAYIASVDPSFAEASEKKAEAIRKEGKREKLTSSGAKSSALPFFEDMNVDSLVIDEAHTAKNSKYLLDFQGAKYLSTAEPSSRGLDMQVKSWFVRSTSPRKDGVYALTATPITNSPLEIYGMLCLAVGEEEVNSRLILNGGADAFMNAFSQITETEEPDIVGRMRAGRVFLGLQNVDMLRMALGQVANIQDANSVGKAITVPEEDPMKTAVELNPQSRAKLSKYQRVYQSARAIINEDQIDEESLNEVLAFSQQTGEPIELLAHPFNLINKMSNLIMDEDLDNLVTRYNFNAGQKDAAEKAVAAFNAKKYTEKMSRPGWNTDPKNITQKVKKDKAGNETTEYTVVVEASIRDGSILIDTVAFDTQSKFLLIAEKLKLDLDCSVSPKVAAFLANFRKEQAMPKAKGIAKQIIFCDMLGMHNKLKLLLSKQCGVPTSKIAIINAKAVTDPAEMQDIQDGFNADGDENSYQVIIANKKAEVGINLQKGTQAIHHLTLGWTPDSLTQRNGRGVRQGNYLSKVTVYHYDANGTFDEYKRQLVGKKDDWISNVMSESGGNSVQISGGISEKDMHDLIVSSGNEAAMEKVRAQIAMRERQRQTKAAREAQVQTLRVIQGQNDWIKKYKDATAWRNAKIFEYVELKARSEELAAKIERSKSETVKARLEGMKADIDARMKSLEDLLTGGSLDWSGKPYPGMGFYLTNYGRNKGEPKPQGSVNPDSALFAKYQSERQNIEKSLDTARTEYKTLAGRPGAYSEETLATFESGDGAVVGGVLLTVGMVGKHKSELWIAKSPTELVNPKTRKVMSAGAAVSGFDFYGPADADEEWLPIAHQCAAIDEATIAENADTGFEIGDERLYSSFSPEIASMVKVKPTGMYANPRLVRLKPPYFPAPVNPTIAANGGALVKKIIAEQADVLQWGTKKDGYYEEVVVRVKDLQFADSYSHVDAREEVFRYAMAHQMKATYADLGLLGVHSSIPYWAKKMVPDFDRNFADALSKAVAEAKSKGDIDSAMDAYVSESFPMLDFGGDASRVSEMFDSTQKNSIDKAKMAIAAGGKPVKWLTEIASSAVVAGKIAGMIAEKIKGDMASLIAEGKSALDGDSWKSVVLGHIIDREAGMIDDAYRVKDDVLQVALSAYQGEKPDGLVVLCDDALPDTINSQFTYCQLKHLRVQASVMLTQQKASGIDTAGLMATIESIRGVESVSVVSYPVYRPAKYGNGSYTYKADLSIAVKTRKGSDAAGYISSKERGLPGRHWDKDNGWMLTLETGEKDSYGKPVASAEDFIEFLRGKL